MRIEQELKQITVVQSNVSGSSFTDVMAEDLKFENCNVARISFNNVNLTAARIADANLSELVVDGAQWGGAELRYIGYSNSEEPAVQKHPNAVKMTGCDLSHGTLADCNLRNVNLVNCDITGLTINGVRIDELLENTR
ncbi:MAG: pentapeptide repeat-containing protein [Paenibacillus sp.]|nr:pentapeptide repeat-containing protein [Paenibacillus sp.]